MNLAVIACYLQFLRISYRRKEGNCCKFPPGKGILREFKAILMDLKKGKFFSCLCSIYKSFYVNRVTSNWLIKLR